MEKESPEYVRTSLAAAMTLGFKKGWFYRDAKLPCINILLTYSSGCLGNCGYCGLSNRRPGDYIDKSFIRVEWPTIHINEIIQEISNRKDLIKRVCLSMITNKRAFKDTITITKKIKNNIKIPISLLITPTILKKDHLLKFKQNGADRIGIAIDCATPDLFDQIRGKGVKGPHKWKNYWNCYEDAIEIFGRRMVGVHLIVGLGETEKEMIRIIQKSYDLGGCTHLFSFFPEKDSNLSNHPQPPIGKYRRIQIGRFLIDEGKARIEDFKFDKYDRIIDFGLNEDQLKSLVHNGLAFMTSGCPGEDGNVACNRPYANCAPGSEIRNYPFKPNLEDTNQILVELSKYNK